ncbi:hypothetical protein DUI87_03380 [Hirundo rustica rustica]|uniref:ribonuclease H n=1 Tax=Hirundo rustica rustica TaxID=333673 RepID=A0A3M0L2Y6_HIRRU|nr:hypothetical protein DUI87_03380 [Hirundo rustica rustica]
MADHSHALSPYTRLQRDSAFRIVHSESPLVTETHKAVTRRRDFARKVWATRRLESVEKELDNHVFPAPDHQQEMAHCKPEPVTSFLENVQGLLNVKDTTFLVFHLVTFLYMVCSFSRMSHTLLNIVGQKIEAGEQGDKSVTQAAANPTAIQAAAKPDTEAKTPAVAAVKKGKKHMDKTDRPVDDDSGEGSSMPPDTQSGVKPTDTHSEAEATDDTQSEAKPTDTKSEAQPTSMRSGVQPPSAQSEARPTATRSGDTIESFSLKDLCGLRKDYTRRPDESIISWLVRLWDAASEATMLDGTEARHLGSLSHDPVIDQEIMREAHPCSLWERVLRSVAQRYLCADDLYMQQTQWKTIEQGIQRLREMAVAEIVFSDDLNTRNPDLVPCTPVMWQKLVRLGPLEYASALAVMKRDDTEETVLDMAKKLQTYADAVHRPTHARIAALETQMQGLADKMEENHKKLREEMKEGFLQISAVQVRGSGTTRKHSPDREGKGIPWAKLWALLRDCGENMKRWDGESTDAMAQRLHELLGGKTMRGSSTRKEAAPVAQGNKECRPQFAFTWRGVQHTWNRLPQGWKHSPTICHGLIQAALEKGEALEHLQYIDNIIMWGNTAMEVFEKGEKIIHILLKAGFAIKKSKVKGPAQEIQFLGVKCQDGRHQITTEVINKITAMSPPTNKKETQAFLGAIGFWRMHIPEYSQSVSPLYLVTHKKNNFHWGPEQQQSLCPDQAGDHSYGSPWSSQDRTSGEEHALLCSREP